MAWTYVAGLPLWDETSHNILRKDCFRILALNARGALRNGGKNLGSERVCNFKNRMKSMTADYDDIGKCQEALNYLA
jgi:Cut8, nuclear proteasome tether protein